MSKHFEGEGEYKTSQDVDSRTDDGEGASLTMRENIKEGRKFM